MKSSITICILSVVAAATAPSLYAQEKKHWDLSAGFSGTESINTGSAADTFYWGPFMKMGYEISDAVHTRLGVRHTQNKFLYDGQGGIARQSNTGFSPGVSWDISEEFSLDGEYTYRLGENNFLEHAGVIALDYTGISVVRFSADMNLGQQKYDFPVSETKVSLSNFGMSFEAAFIASKQWEIPLLLSYMSFVYSTNTKAYTARTLSPGVTYRTAERRWSFFGGLVIGSDSSNYTILGVETRVRYKATENISFRLSASLNEYSYKAVQTKTGGGRVTSSAATSPLGNSSSFQVANIGLEAAYAF